MRDVLPPQKKTLRAGSEVYRDLKHYPDGIEEQDGVILRIESPLYFINCASLRSTLNKKAAAARQRRSVHCRNSDRRWWSQHRLQQHWGGGRPVG